MYPQYTINYLHPSVGPPASAHTLLFHQATWPKVYDDYNLNVNPISRTSGACVPASYSIFMFVVFNTKLISRTHKNPQCDPRVLNMASPILKYAKPTNNDQVLDRIAHHTPCGAIHRRKPQLPRSINNLLKMKYNIARNVAIGTPKQRHRAVYIPLDDMPPNTPYPPFTFCILWAGGTFYHEQIETRK